MGSKLSCCVASTNSPRSNQRRKEESYQVGDTIDKAIREDIQPSLQHISDREPEDSDRDPSTHPTAGPLFLDRSSSSGNKHSRDRSRSSHSSGAEKSTPLKKCSSCSTIFLDDSTVSQPNLKNTIKCVALAVYYHIKNRSRADGPNHLLEIFDEKLHPLSKDLVPADYATRDPEHRHIYKFVRTLFTAAQLTSECAIITLVYIERLLTYAEIEISPSTWKRIVLGAILLSSKVWDDQAVWNVDYCQILKEVSVEDMNELERQFLEYLQFNINVPSSVYAKYYFTLRVLADKNDFVFPSELLTRDRAIKLEAMSRITESHLTEMSKGSIRKTSSMNNIASRRSAAVLS